ncbi:MAG: glycosyltransferase [Phycisphaerales bacterium]|nr:glycosyltransferase [Phycisphaerales bacterium]
MDFRVLILWVLLVLAGGCAFWWITVAIRVARDLPRIPRIKQGLAFALPVGEPLVSVVIPAHNEQKHAPGCIESILRGDYANIEVIVVLDRCTDATRANLQPIAARDSRLKLIDNDSCPKDWAGKCNAGRVGAEQAKGAYVLFTDADVEFSAQLIRASMGMLNERGLQLLSLMSTPRIRHWFEAVVQPVAAMELMRMFPVAQVNRAKNPRYFANGQFMLFERAAYDKLGGHAAVKDDLLEDIAFSRRMKDSGGRGGLAVADGMLMVEMYEKLSEFLQGWKRIYIEGSERVPSRLRRSGVIVGVGAALLPLGSLAALVAGAGWSGQWGGGSLEPLASAVMWTGLLGTLSFLVSAAWIHKLCAAPMLAAFFHPLGGFLIARCFFGAAEDLINRTPVRWGGREYILEPRTW